MSTLALLVVAHLGRWYVQLAFAGPALIIIGYLVRDSVRRRLRERRDDLIGHPDGADERAAPVLRARTRPDVAWPGFAGWRSLTVIRPAMSCSGSAYCALQPDVVDP